MKATESRTRTVVGKKGDEAEGIVPFILVALPWALNLLAQGSPKQLLGVTKPRPPPPIQRTRRALRLPRRPRLVRIGV